MVAAKDAGRKRRESPCAAIPGGRREECEGASALAERRLNERNRTRERPHLGGEIGGDETA